MSDAIDNFGFLTDDGARRTAAQMGVILDGRKAIRSLRLLTAQRLNRVIEIDTDTVATLLEGLVALHLQTPQRVAQSGWSQAADGHAEAKRELLGCHDLVVEMIDALVDVVGIGRGGHEKAPSIDDCIANLKASKAERDAHRLSEVAK